MSKTLSKFSPEVRERVILMVLDHEGEHTSCSASISSLAANGYARRCFMNRFRGPGGQRQAYLCAAEKAEKLKALERENRTLRQANNILRKALPYSTQTERVRPFKR